MFIFIIKNKIKIFIIFSGISIKTNSGVAILLKKEQKGSELII
jgi:hypothetical protein